mmetsp:Transcript_55584/g.63811  ORF Transcript_55584/g.63811 Transcript_55584/m.63811 type:complete len:312 (+) Transcript_55584:86-1021(+)
MSAATKSNYWSEKLGFTAEDAALGIPVIPVSSSSSPAGNPSTSSAVVASASAPSDQDPALLEQWIEDFHARLAAKEALKQKKVNEQLNKDDEEIERWKAIRAEDERLVREKQLTQARQAAMEAALKEQEEAEERERNRIELATTGMSDQAREQWISDDRELQTLEEKLQAKEKRLASLDSILKAGAAIHDARLAAEAESMAQAVAEILRQEQALVEAQSQERLQFVHNEESSRLIVASEEAADREQIYSDCAAEDQRISAAAREAVVANCSEKTRAMIDAVEDPDAKRQLLDELALMATMRRNLWRLESGR